VCRLPDAVVTTEDVAGAKAGREMLARFVGQPRWSLANWLALREPYVIVDEAHTTKTERSFEALKRLNPALILELTATPLPKRSNVLFHVSAQQLQAEDMIKMPITLVEHTRGWQAAVLDAVQTQRLLGGRGTTGRSPPTRATTSAPSCCCRRRTRAIRSTWTCCALTFERPCTCLKRRSRWPPARSVSWKA
jgi:hypothetical protein